MCLLATRLASLQPAGPSPSGVLSTRGSPWWSYISLHTCSEGKIIAKYSQKTRDTQANVCRLLRVLIINMNLLFICLFVNRSWAQCLLPYAFYFCWLSNMVMNIIWLLLWDREYVFFLYLIATHKNNNDNTSINFGFVTHRIMRKELAV